MNSKYQLVSETIAGRAVMGAAVGGYYGGYINLMTYRRKVKSLKKAIEKEKDPEVKADLKNKLVSLIKGGKTIHVLKGASGGAAVLGAIGAAHVLSKKLNTVKYILPK
jgi:hypothetical protein